MKKPFLLAGICMAATVSAHASSTPNTLPPAAALALNLSLNSTPTLPSAPTGNQLFRINIRAASHDGLNPETHQFTSNNMINIINTLTDVTEGKRPELYRNITDWYIADVSAHISLRGLPATLVLDTKREGSTNFYDRTLTIEFAGEKQTFTDRIESAGKNTLSTSTGGPVDIKVYNQLKNWLEGKSGDTGALRSLASAFVSQTAIDPVAGHPNSFMSMVINNNFQIANRIVLDGNTSSLDMLSISPSYSGYTAKTDTTAGNQKDSEKSVYLPIKYSHYFGTDNALFIDLPLNYNSTDSAKTYSASFGLSFMHVFARRDYKDWRLAWAIMPNIHGGAVFSMDMGRGPPLLSGGLGSRLQLFRNKWNYGLTNELDYLKTLSIKVGSMKTPYDFHNIAMQNGLDVNYQINSSCSAGAYYNRMDILGGGKWYIPSYNNIGFKIAKTSYYQNDAAFDRIALTAGYLFAPKSYHGFTVGLDLNI